MNKELIKKAIFALKDGKIICYPTDTLYGLGADIFNKNAVKKIFNIKKRPFNLPISIAVSDKKSIEEIAYTNHNSDLIIKKFLPGKLSIILKKKDIIPKILTGGTDKISIRIPDNKITKELTDKFGPITCTSANVHNYPTPNLINEINMLFKDKISVYLDGGNLSSKPSTIIDLSSRKIKILRVGSITKNQITEAIKNG